MRVNKKKITKEFCHEEFINGTGLIFLPETEDEAIAIQSRLFEMGFAWANGGRRVNAIENCLQYGIVLSKGDIYYRGENDNANYLVCKLSQFDKADETPSLKQLGIDSPELFDTLEGDELLKAVFTKLASRIDNLETELKEAKGQIAEIHERTSPKSIKKAKPLK